MISFSLLFLTLVFASYIDDTSLSVPCDEEYQEESDNIFQALLGLPLLNETRGDMISTEDIFQSMFTFPFLNETKGDTLDMYCRQALSAVAISRKSLTSLEPFKIHESFKAMSILYLPDHKKRGIQILKAVVQQQREAFERESLVKVTQSFEMVFMNKNRHMAIFIPEAHVKRMAMPIPSELNQLASSHSFICALTAWQSFDDALSYASRALRKVYTTPINVTELSAVVEARLSQIEENIYLIWSVDHMHSWGNVTSTLRYTEYIRHLTLAQEDVCSSGLFANHWLRIKDILSTFQSGKLSMDSRISVVDYKLDKIRYFNDKKFSLTASPGCEMVANMQVVGLPTSGIPFVHIGILANKLYVYCSLPPYEKKLILARLLKTNLDAELQQQILRALTSKKQKSKQ